MFRHGTRYAMTNIRAGIGATDSAPVYHGVVPDWYEE
jgi:hypothetical protein